MQAQELIREHERLLFRRAYAESVQAAAEADEALLKLAAEVAARSAAGEELSALEAAEVSGIAGSGMTAVFSYGVAWHLAHTHPEAVRICWEAYDDEPAALGRVLPYLIELQSEDALVEAHVPWRAWIQAASRQGSELLWLLDAIERRWPDWREAADRYDSLQLPLRWEFASSTASRTLMRLPVKRLFCHTGPLLKRRDVSLQTLDEEAPLPVRKLSTDCGALLLSLARDTSAARYRELHGFTWGDARHVYEIDAGRGLKFYLNGVGPAYRLPLRAYHSMSLWKNGVPVGYFEGLSVCERMEAGFNLYYTFREGETAYLYQRVLKAMHQMTGVTAFSVDPYQLGHGNEEGLASGAFWFYRKLGFRSTSAEVRALMEREEARLAARPGARSSPATLKRLVAAPMIFELPGTESGEWDSFSVRQMGLRLAADGRAWRLPAEVERARRGAEEFRYLRAMQRDRALRRRLLKLGRAPAE